MTKTNKHMENTIETTEIEQQQEVIVSKLPHSQVILEGILESMAMYQKRIAKLFLIAPIIDQLPEAIARNIDFYGTSMDFNYLTHAQTIEVIKLIPGKWTKKYNGDADTSCNYVLESHPSGIQIRCWNSTLPDSCRLVEDGETIIPAQPERVVKKYKRICSPQDEIIETNPQGAEPDQATAKLEQSEEKAST